MNMYYGLYPLDTDVSDFVVTAYQAELILRLVTKPEIGWYTRNMTELQPQPHTQFHGAYTPSYQAPSNELDAATIQR